MLQHTRSLVLFVTLIAFGCGSPCFGNEPIVTRDDYNAARELAYKYFLSYRDEYGSGLRVAAMLTACSYDELAAQLKGGLPEVSVYAAKLFNENADSVAYHASRVDMALVVALATQSMVEGYELGYLEATKGEFKHSNSCSVVPKIYEDYVRSRTKPKS